MKAPPTGRNWFDGTPVGFAALPCREREVAAPRNCQAVKVLVFVFTCAPARMKLGVLRYCICSVTVECADAASALEPLRASHPRL